MIHSHRIPFFARALASWVACGALLIACGHEGARETGLEWKNVPMEITARLDKPPAESLKAEGFPVREVSPRRLLKARVSDPEAGGLDSLTLLDFGDETSAYAALQELGANSDDFMDGFAVWENRVYFRRGHWVAVTGLGAWNGMLELENGLSVPGTPAGNPNVLPVEFASLLHQGRVEGSERILTGEFLGLPVPGRVFAARLACQGDTAWIYASAYLARDFGFKVVQAFAGKVDTSGKDLTVMVNSPGILPLKLRFTEAGMAGVEGCFDDSLTNFWIKMQMRSLKKLK